MCFSVVGFLWGGGLGGEYFKLMIVDPVRNYPMGNLP